MNLIGSPCNFHGLQHLRERWQGIIFVVATCHKATNCRRENDASLRTASIMATNELVGTPLVLQHEDADRER
jgi:hypothetical protein